MDKIWDRKSFEVGGHWPLWLVWEKNDKSRTLKNIKIYTNPVQHRVRLK